MIYTIRYAVRRCRVKLNQGIDHGSVGGVRYGAHHVNRGIPHGFIQEVVQWRVFMEWRMVNHGMDHG